jgi:hypothetical protein
MSRPAPCRPQGQFPTTGTRCPRNDHGGVTIGRLRCLSQMPWQNPGSRLVCNRFQIGVEVAERFKLRDVRRSSRGAGAHRLVSGFVAKGLLSASVCSGARRS